MSLVITNAGIAASVRAGDLGIEYKITHISIGTGGYIPDKSQTELQNEIQKKSITRAARFNSQTSVITLFLRL